MFSSDNTKMVSSANALPGRDKPIRTATQHFVNHTPLVDIPVNMCTALFGMGCFWGAERLFWQQVGVYSTAVGYSGGFTPHPVYKEVCTGQTGHTEVVRIIFDPSITSYEKLLDLFWENHNPTQGMRQGADIGTQYRSTIYTYNEEQMIQAKQSLKQYQKALLNVNIHTLITTEITMAKPFYFAEEEHQQYLAKNPYGYCGLQGIGVACIPRKKAK